MCTNINNCHLFELKDLNELNESLFKYSRLFSNVHTSPSKETAKNLAFTLKNLDSFLRSIGRKVEKIDPTAAEAAWTLAKWYLNSDIRAKLSVYIRRVDTLSSELDFERMRFKLADLLIELANRLNILMEFESFKNEIKDYVASIN